MSTGLTFFEVVNTIDGMQARADALEQLIWELRRAFRELTLAADRDLQKIAIRAGDRAFLEFLAKETEPISLSDLARKYSVTRQHIHQTLRRLPNSEWVEQIPDLADRRTVLLRLSRKGRATWDKIRDLDRAFLSRLARRLPQQGVAATTDFLQRIRHELSMEQEKTDDRL